MIRLALSPSLREVAPPHSRLTSDLKDGWPSSAAINVELHTIVNLKWTVSSGFIVGRDEIEMCLLRMICSRGGRKNILAWYLTWPVTHSCALAGISVLSCMVIGNKVSEMLEDPPSFCSFARKLLRVHGLLTSAFSNTECYLASVSGLRIARR